MEDFPNTTPTRETRPKDRRAQILVVATEMFATRGFHNVRMEDIASGVGITARALYRHYDNKQALLSAVILDYQDRWFDAFNQLPQDQEADRSFESRLEVLVDVTLASRGLAWLWQREARHLDHDIARIARHQTMQITRRVEDLVVRPARPDLDDFVSEVRAWAIVSVLTRPTYANYRISPTRVRREVIAACQRIVDLPLPREGPTLSPRAERFPVGRREQILHESARAFRRQGFSGVTLDDIGRGLNLVGPAMYRYFDTKPDILATIISRFYEWEALASRKVLSSTETDADVIYALLRSYLELAGFATDLLAVVLTEFFHLPDREMERLGRVSADNLSEWRRWLVNAQPGMGSGVAALLVNVGRNVVEDQVRIERLRADARFEAELLAVAAVAMGLGEPR